MKNLMTLGDVMQKMEARPTPPKYRWETDVSAMYYVYIPSGKKRWRGEKVGMVVMTLDENTMSTRICGQVKGGPLVEFPTKTDAMRYVESSAVLVVEE